MNKLLITLPLLISSSTTIAAVDVNAICQNASSSEVPQNPVGAIISQSKGRSIVECYCHCTTQDNMFIVTSNKSQKIYQFASHVDRIDLIKSFNDPSSSSTILMCSQKYKSILTIKEADWFITPSPIAKSPYKCFEPLALVGVKVLNYKMEDVTKSYDGSQNNSSIPTGVVTANKSYIYSSPNPNSKTKKYFIQNDVLQLLEAPKKGWVHISFTKQNNRVLEGWLKIEDIKLD